ncbi:hypothetical protein PRK78_005645 [Emydomyces testavorans]|uniref:Leucine-rich repeat domain-containing protein n=1 Tax=Emydomyces testavorans TaxID=2070801 RepID=A0AAF0IJQ4_9EURO|nr:hypothetical protein PRK78_005645 [Emydomyces testavorans]
MAVTLDTLPAELLLKVADNVEKRRDLFQLASCSRRSYDIVIPRAYRSFCLPKASAWHTSALLRAILLNPNLAQWVRELDICLLDYAPVSGLWDECSSAKKFVPVPIDAQLLERAVSSASHSEEEKDQWLTDLKKAKADAYVALMLVQLVGLQKLTIRTLGDGSHCHKIIERAAKGEKPFDKMDSRFPHLVEAKFLDLGHSRYFTSNKFIPLLHFRALRSITAFAIFDDDEPWSEQAPSDIENINLTGRVCVNGLQGLLQNCKNLKTFEYTHCYPGGPDTLDPKRLYSSLCTAKDTLVSVSIQSYQRRVDRLHCAFIGSFAEFKALTHLGLKVQYLHDVDGRSTVYTLLPRSLETLHLADANGKCFDWLLTQLESWAENWKEYTPNLKKVSLETSGTVSKYMNCVIVDYIQKWERGTGGQVGIVWNRMVQR